MHPTNPKKRTSIRVVVWCWNSLSLAREKFLCFAETETILFFRLLYGCRFFLLALVVLYQSHTISLHLIFREDYGWAKREKRAKFNAHNTRKTEAN